MRKWIALALLVAGIGQLVVRGTRRGDDLPLWDFTPNYIATHNWLNGGDPYDIEAIRASWHTMTGSTVDVSAWWSVYPPTMFVVLAPIGMMPPAIAMVTWAAISLTVFIVAIAAMAHLAGLHWRDARMWLLAGGTIASAPAQFGLLAGQPSVVVLSLAFVAVWCIAHDRHRIAGVLLALAAAVKPQVAAPFLFYYLVLRNWRMIDLATLLLCFIAAGTMLLMSLTEIDWITGWSHNLRGTMSDGGVNDIDEDNPWRDQLIHLPVILRTLIDDPLLPRIVAMCLTAVLLALYVHLIPDQGTQQYGTSRDLLALATLGALSLVPVYHRINDAMILVPAYAWALSQLNRPRRRFGLAALVPLSVFLVPFNALNVLLHRVPDVTLTDRWWWRALIEPHYAWAVAGACALLLIFMWQCRRDDPDHRMNLLRSSSSITSARRWLT